MPYLRMKDFSPKDQQIISLGLDYLFSQANPEAQAAGTNYVQVAGEYLTTVIKDPGAEMRDKLKASELILKAGNILCGGLNNDHREETPLIIENYDGERPDADANE